ncbi:hypothetical protein TKK_0014445 [Trichogramma kaykai]|uniref:WD repeat-containing protein 63 n=1 Tax=Trichogramma kaykai TaxID=54128 RepID=A0ABD2WDT2_9HYME
MGNKGGRGRRGADPKTSCQKQRQTTMNEKASQLYVKKLADCKISRLKDGNETAAEILITEIKEAVQSELVSQVSDAEPYCVDGLAQTIKSHSKNATTQTMYHDWAGSSRVQDFGNSRQDSNNMYADYHVEEVEMMIEPYEKVQDLEMVEDNNFNIFNFHHLCWHPTWTGYCAVSVSLTEPNEKFTDIKILIWSLENPSVPKIILKSKAKGTVKTLSYCPYNDSENRTIVVGGLSNGQIVIWDLGITNINSDEGDQKEIWPCIHSDEQHCQKSSFKSIEWLAATHHINETGQIQVFWDKNGIDFLKDPNLQFVAASQDMTISFFDLKWQPSRGVKEINKKDVKDLGTFNEESPYYKLNGIWRPVFKVFVNFQITTMCCMFVPVQPELKSNMDIDFFLKNSEWTEDPFQSQKFTKNIFNYEWQLEESKVKNRYACYENNKNTLKSDKVGDSSGNDDNDDDTKVKLVRPKMFIGTEDGRHLYVTWQGFHTDVINSQHCKIVYEYPEEKPDKPMPVTHAIRSPFFHDILLTINGEKVYIWRVDNPLPCFEYNNEMNPNITYTSGCWDRRDANVILLGTSNGDIEILDLKIQQDILNCSIPKQIKWKKIVNTVIQGDITGFYPHAIPMQPLVIVVSDVKGGLKIYKAKGKKYRVLKEIVDYGTRNERILRELEINNKEWLREFINGRTSDVLIKQLNDKFEESMGEQ